MRARARREREARRAPSTPRLLGRLAPLFVGSGLAVSLAAYYRASLAPEQFGRGQTAATELPPEPPVERLAVDDAGFPCDVERVLRDKCRRCHTEPPRHAAPFSLLTWHETRKLRQGQPIYLRMGLAIESGAMPLGIAANPPVLPLTVAEKRVLLGWIQSGAPRADCPPF